MSTVSGGWWVGKPMGDPFDRFHVVPAKNEKPDPQHRPDTTCPCGIRIVREHTLVEGTADIVVHAGPN